ncbi:hypothetical protein PR048_020801 [Dryococelus australis]|uniref:Uncharacterized protein n=1 Tax=Dryococelus australis TaxID=614101 RepID=A0ABQ9GWE4_9NEOP|nr:hypothetical protein PR048_020801 [Dryococelus australis]
MENCCKLCSKVSCLGAFKKERIAISKERNSYVTYNGSSRATQLMSLRKKIFEHKQSTAHTTAEKIIAKAITQTSAYYIAKNDILTILDILELQQLNGVEIGVGLHSRYSAILEVSGKLYVIDESTRLGATSTLIVYIKCEVRKEIPPYFLFVDLIELPD